MGKKKIKPPVLLEDPEGVAIEKQKEDEMDKGLSTIFKDDDGVMPDMSKLEIRRRPWILYIVGAMIVFLTLLLVSVWVGFIFFKPFKGFGGKGLELMIDGPARVTLGQESTYFINYSNVSNEPLAAAEVRVSFPTDFKIVSMNPEPQEAGMTWRLGSIAYGGRGTIQIKGVFLGALGTKSAIQAVGTYRPASFNSDFEALSTQQLDYTDSVLAGALTVPEKVVPGDKVTFVYSVKNTGVTDLDGLEAHLTLPQGFVRDAGTTSTLDGNVAVFPVGALSAGVSTTVSVTGAFASGVGGELHVLGEMGRLGLDGSFLAAQKTDAAISLLAGDLGLKMVANGSDADRSVNLGDVLHFSLGYENTSGEELKGVALRVKFEPLGATGTTPVVLKKSSDFTLLEWSKLFDNSSGTLRDNRLVWDKSSLEALERMPTGQDGVIEFSIPLIASAASGTTFDAFQATAEADIEYVGGAKLNRTVRTKPMIFRLRSDAKLSAEARYFTEEGAPMGSGPLPPVVGQTTSYRILWEIDKSLHELKDLKVSATLPENVTWSGSPDVSAGELTYDEKTRLLTWSLNKMPVDIAKITAEFDVQLTPTEFDANRFAELIGEIRFDAKDVQNGDSLTMTKDHLTTDLQNDAGAKNKGVVRKP
ncbi:MAG: hypothetical protein RDU25_01620 [Patescibacteria group bacterium]|nr:hypothetical protein [Patescibacteria group bacterium]